MGVFGRKISSRHLSFKSSQDFNNFLRFNTPLFVSYSNAYYFNPSAQPMERKGFLGADLIYEFDCDELPTDCKLEHDSWQCTNKACNASGKGRVKSCPECGYGTKVDEWVCNECLGEARSQSLRLISILENDFAFDGLQINFSGSKGYHIHVRGDKVKQLSVSARSELIDFLTLNGFDLHLNNFYFDGLSYHCPSNPVGSQKRLLHRVKAFLDLPADKIAALTAFSMKDINEFLSKKKTIFDSMARGVLFSLPGRKTEKFWDSVLKISLDEESLRIDRQTSIDIRKIIRVPDTLHGGTGLLAMPVKDLRTFKPLQESVVFGEKEIKIKLISKTPKFELNNKKFGPLTLDQEIALPEFVAVYLVGKQKAIPL